MRFLRNDRQQGEKEGQAHCPVDGDVQLASLLPAVAEYLFTSSYEDGTMRQRSTLLLFYEDGLCKVCLNDRAEGRTMWRSGCSAWEALEALEQALASGAIDWRKQTGTTRRR